MVPEVASVRNPMTKRIIVPRLFPEDRAVGQQPGTPRTRAPLPPLRYLDKHQRAVRLLQSRIRKLRQSDLQDRLLHQRHCKPLRRWMLYHLSRISLQPLGQTRDQLPLMGSSQNPAMPHFHNSNNSGKLAESRHLLMTRWSILLGFPFRLVLWSHQVVEPKSFTLTQIASLDKEIHQLQRWLTFSLNRQRWHLYP